MVSKEKYLEVNGLEEDLQVAFNDVDFNLKLLKTRILQYMLESC